MAREDWEVRTLMPKVPQTAMRAVRTKKTARARARPEVAAACMSSASFTSSSPLLERVTWRRKPWIPSSDRVTSRRTPPSR